MSTTLRPVPSPTDAELPKELQLKIHRLMVQGRALEERLIAMYKQGDGYFWIGGPGEEAFNVPLGLLIHKGQGPQFDYCHFHYRQSATMVAMGADPVDSIRQMKGVASDPYTGGRNFGNHYAKRAWNVCPVTSVIEVQYSFAIGTAIAQKRQGGQGITVVTGGDAGTAEGDFASCLVWASRPALELPILIIVGNNKWGISTNWDGQHGEKRISERAKAFGIEAKTIDGNDPETSYKELAQAMEYVRTQRKPFMLEAMVSRLYGHSSASGANAVLDEADCLKGFEARLEKRGYVTRKEMDEMKAQYQAEFLEAHKRIRKEPMPSGSTIYDHIFQDKDLVRGE
jgi:2-oxoisovalerate dehydrogenase E1 component alpha subunit